ncbi:MAG: BcsE family c-di-GMP-binding protein [Burkholderiaceae bacterium]
MSTLEDLPSSSSRPAGPLPFELGLDGAPVRLGRLAAGMVYAVAIAQQGVRLALIGAALLKALRAGASAAVMTPQDPRQFLRKLALNGVELAEFERGGLLTIHELGAADARADGPRRLPRALQGLDLPARSLIVLDGADDGFRLDDAAGAQSVGGSVQAWVGERDHTLLAIFARPLEESSALSGLAERFAGLAFVREADDQAVLDVIHWFGATGAMTRASYSLEIVDGGLKARPVFGRKTIDPRHEVLLATQGATVDFPQTANGWMQAETMLDAVDKARTIVGGTVLLHFDQMSSLRELAQAVAVLRATPRPQLRIVVRECGARLRVPQVAALMRLGMNMIIPQEVSGQAALAMAESLRGTLSSRHYEPDLERLLDGADLDQASQVVGVADFRRHVAEMLGRASTLDVPVCLVRFSAVSPQAMRAVIGALSRGRNCLFTQHDGGGWMLLYGCLPERAAGVMARLLGARFEKLLADFQLLGEQGEILRAIRLLDHAAVNLSDAVFENTVIREEFEGSSESGFASS